VGFSGNRGRRSLTVGCLAATAILASCRDDDGSGNGDTATEPQGEAITIGSLAEGGSDVAPEGNLEAKVSGGDPQSDSLQVGPDARVAVTATISNADEDPQVRLLIPRGPAPELPVELGALDGDSVSTLTVRSSGGPLTVGQIRYRCSLPPRTFCPVQTVKSKESYELRMVPGEDGQIQVRLELGPETTKQPSGKKPKSS
jgi:hypothetical protein